MKKIPEGHALVRIEDLADLQRRASRETRPRIVVTHNSGAVLMDCRVGPGRETFELPDGSGTKLTVYVPL